MNSRPLAVRLLLSGWLVLLIAAQAFAIDTWLVVDRHAANEGDPLWLAVVTGPVFPLGDKPMDPARLLRLTDTHGDETTEIAGLAPEDNALSVRTPIFGGGLHIFGCELAARTIELDPATFDAYLRENRADDAIAIRKAAGPDRRPIIERYTKYAKTIVRVQPADPDDLSYTTPIGHRLEIVPLSDPSDWRTQTNVQVQVLLDGHPWPGVSLFAGREGIESPNPDAIKTDANGKVSISLTQPGHWYLKAHFIRPASGLVTHAWESLWATFTFSVRGKINAGGAAQAIRAIHGRLTPWTVVGYRMGQDALAKMGLSRGSLNLVATHYAPLEQPYASVVDGVQAATGAALGRLNLRLRPADIADLRCEFADAKGERKLVYRIRAAVLTEMQDLSDADSRAVAMRLLTLAPEDLFVCVEQAQPAKAPASPKASPAMGLSAAIRSGIANAADRTPEMDEPVPTDAIVSRRAE